MENYINCSLYESDKYNIGSYDLSENLIIFVLNGEKTIYCKEWFSEIKSGEFIMINNNHYVMTELLKNQRKFQSIIINFNNIYFKQFLDKYNISSINTLQPPFKNKSKTDEYLTIIIESLQLLTANEKQSALLHLKLEELLLYIYLKKSEIFQSFQKKFEQSITIKNNQNIQILDEFYKLNISEIAFLHHMSESTFKRNFKKIYHTSPKQYFIKHKMQLANRLISEGLSIKEIATQIGYENTSSFSREFKNYHGYTASSIKMT